MSDITPTQELDARKMNCPLPVLKTKKALKSLAAGDVLKVVATDPGSVKDFAAFAKQTGNQLLDSREDAGKFFYLLKKA